MVFRGQKLRESNNQINFDRSTKNHAFLRCPTYRRFRGKLKWRWHSGHSISISYQTLSEPRYVYIMQLYWLFFCFFFVFILENGSLSHRVLRASIVNFWEWWIRLYNLIFIRDFHNNYVLIVNSITCMSFEKVVYLNHLRCAMEIKLIMIHTNWNKKLNALSLL